MMQNGYLTQTTEKRLMIVSGGGYPELAERIADRLDIDLAGVELHAFANGELYARYLESVRGETCSSCSRCATLSTRT